MFTLRRGSGLVENHSSFLLHCQVAHALLEKCLSEGSQPLNCRHDLGRQKFLNYYQQLIEWILQSSSEYF